MPLRGVMLVNFSAALSPSISFVGVDLSHKSDIRLPPAGRWNHTGCFGSCTSSLIFCNSQMASFESCSKDNAANVKILSFFPVGCFNDQSEPSCPSFLTCRLLGLCCCHHLPHSSFYSLCAILVSLTKSVTSFTVIIRPLSQLLIFPSFTKLLQATVVTGG